MSGQFPTNLSDGMGVAGVPHDQGRPSHPSHAAHRIAPGHPGPEGQLGPGVPVAAASLHVLTHLVPTFSQRPGRGLLAVELFEELVRLGQCVAGVKGLRTCSHNYSLHLGQ